MGALAAGAASGRRANAAMPPTVIWLAGKVLARALGWSSPAGGLAMIFSLSDYDGLRSSCDWPSRRADAQLAR